MAIHIKKNDTNPAQIRFHAERPHTITTKERQHKHGQCNTMVNKCL